MRTRMISAAAVAALAISLFAAPAAMAQGGSGGGGGGGAPAPSPSPAPAPSPAPGGTGCVNIDKFNVTVDQSVVTADAAGTADIALSRCGSSGRGYTVTMTATDPSGSVAWTTTDTWTPARSLPFTASRHTDSLAFDTAYHVTLAISDTGTAVSSKTVTLSTPAARVPGCASILSMNASGGYNPGTKAIGAIWAGYKVQNCGGADQLDMELVESNQATGIVAWRNPYSAVMAGGGTGGVGLVDNDYAPLATTYDVVVNVREHSTGLLLDSRTLVASTPG